jgi:predicted RNA-binding protein with PUA-like domain
LRKIKRGDRVLMYHTGKEKAVVGVMRVVSGPQADPTDADPKAVAVEVAPVRLLRRSVPLATIKADPHFKGWELVRMPRLSVMPVTEKQWQRIEELSETEPK